MGKLFLSQVTNDCRVLDFISLLGFPAHIDLRDIYTILLGMFRTQHGNDLR